MMVQGAAVQKGRGGSLRKAAQVSSSAIASVKNLGRRVAEIALRLRVSGQSTPSR